MGPLAITRLDAHTSDGMLRPDLLNSKTVTSEILHNCLLWPYIKEFHAQMHCSYEVKEQINASAEVVILKLQNEYELKSVIGYTSFHRRDKCKNLLTKTSEFIFIYVLFLQCNMNLVTSACW